jgi:hypothetical protein
MRTATVLHENHRQPRETNPESRGDTTTEPKHAKLTATEARKRKGASNKIMQRKPNSHKQAKSRQARALHIIARKLEIGACNDCKLEVTNTNFMAFHFDHIDRTLKYKALSKMVKDPCTLADIDNEIAKCRLLCANCHAIRTYYNRDHDQITGRLQIEHLTLFDDLD